MALLDKFWHRTLHRPYRLNKPVDQGGGAPILLLHGIGRTGGVWQHVVEALSQLECRVIAFDLLGFGDSPKPDWLDYDVDDHANAVIASIERLMLKQPLIIVGHSMGCLVAVRVARLRPDLVRHLVLYEMPLYEGLPDSRRYRLRLDIYRKFYNRIVKYNPTFDETAKLLERIGRKVIGFEVTPETWLPFKRSLANTIMKQTTAEDIKQLDVAVDVVYGTLDMFVIRGEPQAFFGSDSDNIKAHSIKATHIISAKASLFIIERIVAVMTPSDQGVLG